MIKHVVVVSQFFDFHGLLSAIALKQDHKYLHRKLIYLATKSNSLGGRSSVEATGEISTELAQFAVVAKAQVTAVKIKYFRRLQHLVSLLLT